MSITIKRYPNRKLYNTETKRYITLDGIATLIRDGEDVAVVDHQSGEDLTSLTLTQIIFEQEKKSSGFLPTSILTGLIQGSSERLETIRKSLGNPRELLEPVEAEIDRRIRLLIKRGELAQNEGLKLRDKMLDFKLPDLPMQVPDLLNRKPSGQPKAQAVIDDEVIEVVEETAQASVASDDDIKALSAQVEALSAQVEALLTNQKEA